MKNLENETICFFPLNNNCSQSYLNSTTRKIGQLRTSNAILVLIVLITCIINNSISIYVFNRKQFKGKLLTQLIQCLYIGNILYVIIYSTHVFIFYTFPFEIGVYQSYVCCRVTWASMRIGIAIINWLLAASAFIRMNMTVFPTKLMVFRSNTNNTWLLLATVVAISILSNIHSLINPELTLCTFSGRTVCVIKDYDIVYFVFGYYISLVICVFCSIVIYHHCNKAKRQRSVLDARIYSPVNRMVISSSFLFAVSSIPQSVYYYYFESESDVYCDEDNDFRFVIYPLMIFVLLCHNSFDSTIYFIVSPSYRKIVKRRFWNCWFILLGKPKIRTHSSFHERINKRRSTIQQQRASAYIRRSTCHYKWRTTKTGLEFAIHEQHEDDDVPGRPRSEYSGMIKSSAQDGNPRPRMTLKSNNGSLTSPRTTRVTIKSTKGQEGTPTKSLKKEEGATNDQQNEQDVLEHSNKRSIITGNDTSNENEK